MPTMRTKEDGHWPKFCQYAEETGISLDYVDDWEQWWDCWNAALDAGDDEYLANRGIEPMENL